MPAPPREPAGSPPTDGRRPRRWLRRLATVVVALPLAALAAWWVLTRPAILAMIVAWKLSSVIGGEVRIDAVHRLDDGQVIIENLSVRAPGWSGPAGEVASVSELRTQLTSSAWWRGDIQVSDLSLVGATLRIAERADRPNEFNIFALEPRARDASSERRLPRIELATTTIETGDLDPDGRFVVRGRTHVAGELRLEPGAATRYAVRLDEVAADGAHALPGGMQITGTFDSARLSGEFRLGRLRFDDRILALMPRVVRDWWTRLEIRGEILSAEFSVSEDAPPAATLVMGASELTIPVDTGLRWMVVRGGRMEPSRGRPRIQMRGGTITLKGNSASLQRIEGQIGGTGSPWPLASVPLRIDLTIPDLPRFTWENRTRWLDEALATTGFDGRVELLNLTVGLSRPDEAIELPYVVADILDAFRLSNWQLSAEVRVHREGPIFNAAGRPIARAVKYAGKAAIGDGTMRYERFPYPLKDVRGLLTFDEESIVIDSLRGRGRDGGQILVTGRIAPPGPQAGFDVRIAGAGTPIDERLRRALPAEARAALDSLLDRQAILGLTAAGLLPDDEQLRTERSAAAATLAAQVPGSDEAAAAAGALESIDRRLEVGGLRPGGTLGFEVDVTRPVGGPVMPMSLTGRIDLTGATAVFDRFPYPFRITKGAIRLSPEMVDLGPGVEVVTAGGGVGRVEGRVGLPKRADGSTGFEPDLQVTVAQDRVNPVLLAAIPPSRTDLGTIATAGLHWPGTGFSDASRLIEAVALHGELGAKATIRSDPNGDIRWDVVASLDNGTAMPTPALDRLLSGSRLLWPAELALSDLKATLRAGLDLVAIRDLAGRTRGAAVTGHADIDLTAEPPTVNARASLDGVPIEPWMADLAPEADRPRLQDLWRRLDPSGTLDATVQVSVIDGNTDAALGISPRTVQARLAGRSVTVVRRAGSLGMSGRGINLDGLELALSAEGDSHGLVTLDGVLPDGSWPGQVRGSWSDARFECPVIEEALALSGMDDALAVADEVSPSGDFTADFDVSLARDWSVTGHRAAISPRTLELVLEGAPLRLDFAEGEVISSEGRVDVEGLRGTHEHGTFAVSGAASLVGEPLVELDLAVESDVFGPAFQALLPDAVHEALDAVVLDLGGGFDAQGRLALRDSPAGWSSSWRGPIAVRGGSLRPGIAVTDVDGSVIVDASGGGSEPTQVRVDLALERLRVAGRRIDGASGTMELDPVPVDPREPRLLRLKSLRGALYGGVAEVFGTVDPSRDGEYAIGLDVAGAGLAGIRLDDGRDPGAPGSAAEGDAGRVRARIAVAGRPDEPGSRRGRGTVFLDDARIAEMPIMLALLQLSQLMLPVRGSLSEGLFEFHMLGDTVTFERLTLASETLELLGSGTLDLGTMTVATRFDTRGRLPLFSDLMSPISGTIMAIDVSGPLEDPRASLVPLPTLQAMLAPHQAAVAEMRPESASPPLRPRRTSPGGAATAPPVPTPATPPSTTP